MKKLKILFFLTGLLCLTACDHGNTSPVGNTPEPGQEPSVQPKTIILKVNYLQQNLNDDNYTTEKTDSMSVFLSTGKTITYSDYKDEFEGFTLQNFDDIIINENTTQTEVEVNLKYDRKIFTVTYVDGLDGKAKNMPEPVKCRYGAKIPKPETEPTCKGYLFVYWNIPGIGTVYGDTTVTAKWYDNYMYPTNFDDLYIVSKAEIYEGFKLNEDNVIYTLDFSCYALQKDSIVTWIIDGKTKDDWKSLGFVEIILSEDTRTLTITKKKYDTTWQYEEHQIIAVTSINGVPYSASKDIY